MKPTVNQALFHADIDALFYRFRVNTGGNSEQENTLNQLLVEMDGSIELHFKNPTLAIFACNLQLKFHLLLS